VSTLSDAVIFHHMQANREAPSLRFVKPDSEPRASTTASLTATFAPATTMEAEVAAMLAAAGAGSGKAVEEAEDALTEKVRCRRMP